MARVLVILFLLLMTGYALSLFTTYQQHLAIESPTPAAVILAQPAPLEFSETGTLVFYPNNVGPVPYIFYKNSSGATEAKALLLPYGSNVAGSWTGSHIFVTGTAVAEHVVVKSISYVAAP